MKTSTIELGEQFENHLTHRRIYGTKRDLEKPRITSTGHCRLNDVVIKCNQY